MNLFSVSASDVYEPCYIIIYIFIFVCFCRRRYNEPEHKVS